MSMNDLELPEVTTRTLRGKFFKDPAGHDKIEIGFAGCKDTVVQDVTPEFMAQYRAEWNAYCDGRPLEQRAGTALTALVNEDRAKHLIHMNVHTIEELAMLDDMSCQQVGHGTMTERKAARKLLSERQYNKRQADQKRMEVAMAAAAPVKDAQADAKLDKLISIGEQTNQALMALVQALQPRKPGRPKKEESDG